MAQLVGIVLLATLLFVHFSTRAAPMPPGAAAARCRRGALPGARSSEHRVFSDGALRRLLRHFSRPRNVRNCRGRHRKHHGARHDSTCRTQCRGQALRSIPLQPDACLRRYGGVDGAHRSRATPIRGVSLILRGVLIIAFAIPDLHATVTVMLIATIGYTYCLLGGYNAVFRTDIVQLVMIVVMCFVLIAQLMARGTDVTAPAVLARFRGIHPGFWFADALPGRATSHAVDFAIGFPMGLMFLLASPDTWKRVFIVSKRDPHVRSLIALFAAGAFPFILIAPLVVTAQQLSPAPSIHYFSSRLPRRMRR